MTVAKVKTKATISIATMESGLAGTQKSGLPLAGKFIFSCTDPVSKAKISTGAMLYNNHVVNIQESITASIPFLADKIEVIHSHKYPYYENGREFFVHFRDVHLNPAQCTIESDTTTPLTGNKDA